ncbi:MAG: serine protease, partial [Planctomycetota bacterium]
SGPMDMIAEGLPAGVRLVYPPMPGPPIRNMGYQPLWLMQLVADATAAPSSAFIKLAAKQNDAPFTLADNRLVVAVTEPAPISIEIVPPTIPLVRGGELAITVKLTRRAGFTGDVDFQCGFPPAGSHGLGLPPKATIPAGETEAVMQVSANPGSRTIPLYVWATTHPDPSRNGNFMGAEVVRVCSEIITINVADPFVELASQPQSVRRGGRAQFKFAVTQKSPFEGSATVRLLGLPKGVHVIEPLPTIMNDSKEVVFDIEATDEALLGPVSGLTCELIIETSGQEVRQRAGNGTLRIDPKL